MITEQTHCIKSWCSQLLQDTIVLVFSCGWTVAQAAVHVRTGHSSVCVFASSSQTCSTVDASFSARVASTAVVSGVLQGHAVM